MRSFLYMGLVSAALMAAVAPVNAQTLTGALASTYSVNPELNSARSQLRSIDEGISIARAGNRPTLSAGLAQSFATTRSITNTGNGGSSSLPTAVSVTLTQPLFQGFTVRNSIRQAESAVKAQRSALENTEQSVLLWAATAFEDVIQNRKIVRLRRSDIQFLNEQVRAAQDRFEVGEGTRTDVSQAEARRAEAQSLLNFAIANAEIAEASFFQDTGLKAGTLVDDIPIDRLLPKSVDAAVVLGQKIHPAIIAALFDVDTAMFNVKAIEGTLLPSLNLSASASTSFNQTSALEQQDSATVGLSLTIPIYQGGLASARVRQAKEDLGTSRIQVDLTRDAVRQNTVASFASYVASVRSIQSARTSVFAAQLALDGVIEEQRVGQRTTLDVLDAQSELVSSQITLVSAERDKDVTAFQLLSAIGQLSARRLGLNVQLYRPKEHTDAVRDKWFGLRTPDGR